jgi:hypothetical protein
LGCYLLAFGILVFSGSSGWSQLGGEQKTGNPAVAQDADGKLIVFMHGLNDNILYEKRQVAPNSNTYSD